MTADSSAYASGPARYGLCSTGRCCSCFAPVVRALHRALVPPGAKPVMKISTKDWPKCYCLRAVHLSHDANPFCDRRWQLCRCIWCVPAALDPPGSWEGRQFQMASAPADSPARRRHGWPERCARAAARPRAARRAEITPLSPQASRPSPAATPSRRRRTSRSCDRRPSAFERPLPLAPTPATRPRRSVRRLTTRDTTAP